MTTTINASTTKTYAHKHDAKRAAIRSGIPADSVELLQDGNGRWSWVDWTDDEGENMMVESTEDQASVVTDEDVATLEKAMRNPKTRSAVNEKLDKMTRQQRKVADRNAKAQAKADRKAKKGKAAKKEKIDRGPTFAAQVVAAAKKGQKIDKEFVKKVLGDIDDKKARRIARQVNRSR